MSILIGELVANMVTDFSRFTRDITQAQRQGGNFGNQLGSVMTRASQSMANVGSALTKYITLPLIGAGTAVFKFGKDFEVEMSKIEGLTGTAKKQTEAWGESILKLSPEVGKMPKELGSAMYFIASAGFKGKEGLDILTSSAKAATSGLGETKDIANLVTSAMNAYRSTGMTAVKATDILIEAVKQGKTDADEFAKSLGQVLPIASVMSVSFDQVAGIVAILSRNGLDAAEATTQLKGILSSLIKPCKQAEDTLTMMGTSSAELRKKIREEGLLSVLTDLSNLTKKYGEDVLADVFPNIRAFSGVLGLANINAKDNAGIMSAMANCAGDLDKAFKTATETLDFKWNQTLAKVQTTLIAFYDVLKSALIPILDKVVKALDVVTTTFKSMPENMQKTILVIAGIAAAIGPSLLIASKLIGSLGFMLESLGTISTYVSTFMQGTLVSSIGALATPIAVIVSAIAVLIAQFVLLWKGSEDFRNKVIGVWNQVKDTASSVFNDIKNVIMIAFDAIKSVWQGHGDTVINFVKIQWNTILNYISLALNIIKYTVKFVCSLITGDWSGAWEAIKKLTMSIIMGIKDIVVGRFMDIYNAITGLSMDMSKMFLNAWETVKAWTVNKWSEIKEVITSKFTEIVNGTKSFINNLPDNILKVWETIKKETPKKLEELKNYIVTKFNDIKNGIIDWCKSVPESLIKLWDDIVKSVNSLFKVKSSLTQILTDVWNSIIAWCKSIPTKFSEMWDSVVKIWNTKLKPISEALSTVFNDIMKIIGGFVAQIVDVMGNVWEAVKKAIIKKYTEIKNAIIKQLEEWGKAIREWFIKLPDTIVKLLEGWKKALKKYCDQQSKQWSKDLSKWWETISKWFSEAPAKIGKSMELWWKSIKKWFVETKKNIVKQLEEWWTGFKTWFTEAPEKISKEFELWWKSIKKWFVETKKNIVKQLEDWWEGLKTFFTESPTKIVKELGKWWESMKKWFIETKKNIGKQLEDWWTGIKEWFGGLGSKKEIEDSGKNMLKKLKKGVTDTKEKKDFMDKLGKLIVDVAQYAIIAAGFALLATGKEIVKRIASAIDGLDLKKSGEKLINSLIKGIEGMLGKVGTAMSKIAKTIRSYLPFSPAKEGPLKDLNKINFYSSLEDSLNKARSKISVPAFNLGQEIIKNVGQNPTLGIEGIGNNTKNLNFGTMNFYGIKDMNAFMREMQVFIQRHTGRTL